MRSAHAITSAPEDRLGRDFFNRPTLRVARELIGKFIVRSGRAGRIAAMIVETEAYKGPRDLAAHTAGGRRTARVMPLYADGGTAYVYLVYGLHHCANVVCGPGSKPEAVLLRAAELTEGEELARSRRGQVPSARLAAGPGNLASAFGIAVSYLARSFWMASCSFATSSFFRFFAWAFSESRARLPAAFSLRA